MLIVQGTGFLQAIEANAWNKIEPYMHSINFPLFNAADKPIRKEKL
jgi:hypothetical protein